MAELTANQRSFIQMMKRSDEHARRGFALLAKHDDLEGFFDALTAEGFFAPDRNPAPVPGDSPDTVRIPFWAALEYLTACAKVAGDRQDSVLARKVMDVLRAVTGAEGGMRDNHHTARHFAEILGLLPVDAATVADMDLVQEWVAVRFNAGGVAQALDRGPMRRFLESASPDDWRKALRVLLHCTAIRWEAKPPGTDTLEPVPVIEAYWLDEFLKHHRVALGQKLAREVVDLLEARVREVFGQGGREKWSYVFRPAVEEHAQNRSWRGPENSFVESLRDVILVWSDADAPKAKECVERLLHSDVEILRRIAIHVIDERWALLGDLYTTVTEPAFFNPGHIHELYQLLQRRFDQFTTGQQTATLEAIRNIAVDQGDDRERRLKRIQLRWLSALRGATAGDAKLWFTEVQEEAGVNLPSHPDFNSYSETFVGPGPAPYQPAELVGFAKDGQLVTKLNAFAPTDVWRGPTVEGLEDAVEQAVAMAPGSLLHVLPTFVDAAPRYQHAIIRGFKKLWDGPPSDPSFRWDTAWPQLMTFFQTLVAAPAPPEDEGGGHPRFWILSTIAEFLGAGTRADDHSYPASLLPRTWSLIKVLLEEATPVDSPDEDDPMFQAINSTKGKVIEALLSHALRSSRLADKASGSHDAAWDQVRAVFDAELAKCTGGNFEFSTLAAANLAQMDYLSAEWTQGNMSRMFPDAHPSNFRCAVGGLAYCVASRRIYGLLRDAGVIDRALQQDLKARDARTKIVERLMLAYLWGADRLDSSRFSYIFSKGLVHDLETAAWFLWSVRGDQISEAQREKVIDYWARAVEWAETETTAPVKLLASLGRLAWSVKTIDDRTRKLLLAVAPHMHRNFSVYEFLEDLSRLVEVNPAVGGEVLRVMIEASGPVYDYEDRLQSLIMRLAELGQKAVAIECCNKVISIPGMDQVFKKLTS